MDAQEHLYDNFEEPAEDVYRLFDAGQKLRTAAPPEVTSTHERLVLRSLSFAPSDVRVGVSLMQGAGADVLLSGLSARSGIFVG